MEVAALFDPTTELREAIELLRREEAGAAARRLKEVAWRDPSNGPAYAALGVALLRLGDAPAAVQALERAHYLLPQDACLLHQYALALQAAGRPGDAALRFQSAMALHAANGGGQAASLLPGAASEAPLPRDPSPALAAGILGGRARPAEANPSAAAPPSMPSPFSTNGELPDHRAASAAGETAAIQEAAMALERSRERPPGFLALIRAALQLWSHHPLLLLGLFAAANALAMLVPAAASGRAPGLARLLVAFVVAAGPAVVCAANVYRQGRPFAGRSLRAFLRSSAVLAGGGALSVVPAALFVRALAPAAAPPSVMVLLGLALSSLAVPLLGWAAARSLFSPDQRAARLPAPSFSGAAFARHLAVVLACATGIGALLCPVVWWLSTSTQVADDAARPLFELAYLSVGESAWAVLVTICAADALNRDER